MTPGFIEERFPLSVAFGASGGPQWRTEVVTLASGAEMRNARRAGSWRRYDAGTGVASLADLQTVTAFFERVRGRLTGFRFRDPFDHASPASGNAVAAGDCLLGEGDGTRTQFLLAKTYGTGALVHVRRIAKPVAGTVRVAVDGAELTEGDDFTCDMASGTVVLSVAPVPGAAVTSGFRFDVPVRFDTDALDLSLTHFEAGRAPTIPLVEIDPLPEGGA
ncbi:DUF2460 domain-containing protein [Stappia sp. MMSF_3263]|uniref:DUF2460 domain-containing protein n=1 Tax=Stappia sp. MMSF_3263 TaxID=3046693 RepID=UPI00273D6D17|nr:DUF2460 domain-containing protein [Stappia sp. MMSF_3263]